MIQYIPNIVNFGKGKDFNMSGLYLNSDGTYKDRNYNVIGSINSGMTKDAYRYLFNKYGKEYADRANENVIHGNVYQDNKWRVNIPNKMGLSYNQAIKEALKNPEKGLAKTKYGYVFKDSKGGYTYFNQSAKDKERYSQRYLKSHLLYDKPLLLSQIPTRNKLNIIDNYSPNFNYIVEGDKIYYGKKGLPYWRDISDNMSARNNLFNFLHDRYLFRGYLDNEAEIYNRLKSGQYNYYHNANPKRYFIHAPSKKQNQYTIQQYENPYLTNYYNSINVAKNIQHNIPESGFNYKPVHITKNDLKIKNPGDFGQLWNYLIDGDFGSIGSTIYNGVKRKLLKLGLGELANVVKNRNVNFNPVNSKYGIRPASYTGDTIRVNGNNRQYIIPESIDVNEYSFKPRNRGDYKQINTEGAIITAFDNFVPYGKQEKANTYIGVDKNGKLKVGDISNFQKGDMLTKTYSNKITSFVKDRNGKLVYKQDRDNPGRGVPIVTTIGGKRGSINVLTTKGKWKGDTYGNITGGRVLVKVGNETRVLSGSVENIEREFEQMKKRNHMNYGTFYTLDNGSYNRGLRTRDKKLTSKDLRNYDMQNTTGGNFLYISSKNRDKYPSDTILTPNVRTKNDQSYKKGHSLINAQLGIVLHHTAGMEKDLTRTVKRLTNPYSGVSSHVVIGFDGERKVLANPNKVTFHAGESRWGNKNNVNDFMIGIEFQGDTNKKNLTRLLIESAVEYMIPIIRKNKIPLENIVTHELVRDAYNEYAKKSGRKQGLHKPDINYHNYVRILAELKRKIYYLK